MILKDLEIIPVSLCGVIDDRIKEYIHDKSPTLFWEYSNISSSGMLSSGTILTKNISLITDIILVPIYTVDIFSPHIKLVEINMEVVMKHIETQKYLNINIISLGEDILIDRLSGLNVIKKKEL